MTNATDMLPTLDGHWIDGAVHPAGGDPVQVMDPTHATSLGTVRMGTAADVEAAVVAARRALPAWSAAPVDARGRALAALADRLEMRADRIAATIAADVGMPLKLARAIQTNLPIATTRAAADLCGTYAFERTIGNSRVAMQPVGVVGAITPWNYPLHQVMAKVAMALGAGCTVVLKPSEIAPFAIGHLVEAAAEAGLPPGVLNVVWGDGPTVGQAMVEHPGIDMISFTGSTDTGRRLSAAAGGTLKRLSMELGGKSPSLVLAGADIARAAKATASNAMLNSGQTCTAWTRLIVPATQADAAAEAALAAMRKLTMGDPFADGTRLGPLTSADQRDRVRGFVARAEAAGASITIAAQVPADLDGYFYPPTLVTGADPASEIVQEEVFGPVLTLQTYDDPDEGIALAEGTAYGLAGAVWAGDDRVAEAAARRLRIGQVDINGGRYNPLAPFGGFKASGHGREMGVFGFEDVLEPQSLQF